MRLPQKVPSPVTRTRTVSQPRHTLRRLRSRSSTSDWMSARMRSASSITTPRL